MSEHEHTTSGNLGYESTDIQVKWAAITGVAVVLLTAFGYFVSVFVVKALNARPEITTYTPTPLGIEEASQEWPAGVRLQVDPPSTLEAIVADMDYVAHSYGVVSDQPEIYRIPIDTAMDLVAERGLPKFPTATGESTE